MFNINDSNNEFSIIMHFKFQNSIANIKREKIKIQKRQLAVSAPNGPGTGIGKTKAKRVQFAA